MIQVKESVFKIFEFCFRLVHDKRLQKQPSLRDECFPVNLLHNFRTPFPKNNSERLLLRLLNEYEIQ